MKKIRLGILLKDQIFANRFAESICDEFDVTVLDGEGNTCLERFDFIVSDEEEKGDICLMWNYGIEDEYHIYVFDGINKIKKKIIYAYSLKYGDYTKVISSSVSNIICVCSAYGGSGSSMIAMSLCRILRGKNLYITFDQIPYEDRDRVYDSPVDINRFMYMVNDERKNISADCVTYLDSDGISNIRYGKPYNIMTVAANKEFQKLLYFLTFSGFDNLIIDTGSVLNRNTESVYEMCTKLLCVETVINERSIWLDEYLKGQYGMKLIKVRNMVDENQSVIDKNASFISYISNEKKRKELLDEELKLFINSIEAW